jgi:hypothetical protein
MNPWQPSSHEPGSLPSSPPTAIDFHWYIFSFPTEAVFMFSGCRECRMTTDTNFPFHDEGRIQ